MVEVLADDPLQGRMDLGEQPRIRFEAAVACLAGSSSKPPSIDGSAACSSATTMERKARGRDLEASAIIDASRASVLASPGRKSAIRRMARPGR